MNRRDSLRALSALPLVALGGAACAQKTSPEPMPQPTAPKSTLPVLFLAHGAPILLDEPDWVGALRGWAGALPKPASILVISAHWEARPTTLGATRTVPLYYDFYGFPARYYETQYPAPGAPALAERVTGLLSAAGQGPVQKSERGLDHGAYVPLVCMYPEAETPVLQLSMPSLSPKELFALGRALGPLRDEGVLILASGFLTHNMRFAFKPGTPAWAREFDAWTADVLARRDVDALLDFEAKGPAARTALPTTEHFAPVIVAAGAAADGAPVSFPIEGFWMDGAFTKRSVQWG